MPQKSSRSMPTPGRVLADEQPAGAAAGCSRGLPEALLDLRPRSCPSPPNRSSPARKDRPQHHTGCLSQVCRSSALRKQHPAHHCSHAGYVYMRSPEETKAASAGTEDLTSFSGLALTARHTCAHGHSLPLLWEVRLRLGCSVYRNSCHLLGLLRSTLHTHCADLHHCSAALHHLLPS